MNRVTLLPENQLVSNLDTLESLIDSIKLKQFMGYDVLVAKVNETSNPYDLTSSDDGFGSQVIIDDIIFTSDNQPYVFATIAIKLYDTSGNPLSQSFFDAIRVQPIFDSISDYQAKFSIDVEKYGATVFRAKVYVLATDTGTITI